MIQYLIGAGIGYLLAQIENESKAKMQPANDTQPQLESQKNEENSSSDNQEPETKKVEFVAKSRGKKKSE